MSNLTVHALEKMYERLHFGVEIYYSETALAQTTERNFPASRNRSKRIHKKLCKRFGGEFRMKPVIWRIGDKLIAHPIYKAQIEAQFHPSSQERSGT